MEKDIGTSPTSVPKGECRPEDFQHDALVIRTCKKDGTSYGDFKYPLQVGGKKLKPDTPYKLSKTGKFVRAA